MNALDEEQSFQEPLVFLSKHERKEDRSIFLTAQPGH
jgi:hypothetical protein